MKSIGIIAESKNPPDNRSPFTPAQLAEIQSKYPVKIFVESSNGRCFRDEDFISHGISVVGDISHVDIIFGIKEIAKEKLYPHKTYLFFSHTIKKQPYNRDMLRVIIERGIELIDYELLVNERGERIAAFGYFAGMVGAHNTMYAYAKRMKLQELPRMYKQKSYADVKAHYSQLRWPPVKIVVTGTGRVANGAVKVLQDMKITPVSPSDFLNRSYDTAVYTQLGVLDYYSTKDGREMNRELIRNHPEILVSTIDPYLRIADVLIHGIFWSKEFPAFFTLDQMRQPWFKVRTIGDITCDIMPHSSIPSTIRASTIEDPVYGFDPKTNTECPAYNPHGVDVMAIDNLPNELARDASEDFGTQLMLHVIPELLENGSKRMCNDATICKDGQLTPKFLYLEDYINEYV